MPEDQSSSKVSWLIGRAEDCDIVLNDTVVGNHHCRLTQLGSEFSVEDLNSRNGVFLNGKRIDPGEKVIVQYGARITLGTIVEMPWPKPPNGRRAATMPSPPPNPGKSRRITIGRDPKSDIAVELPTISWNHAVIYPENGQYILEDNNSTNKTAIGQRSNTIHRSPLDPNTDVFLGSYKMAASELLGRAKMIEMGSSSSHNVVFPRDKKVIEMGRDPQSDVPLEFPMVSWRHARLTRVPDGILVEDLGSRNGTYVDGVRVAGKVLVKPGQEIGLGSFRFQLQKDGALQQREYFGNVTIEAKDIVVQAPHGKKYLLSPVSLTVFPSELVAVMGPAGSGKTTLLKALNGYTSPANGTVLFNGVDLYQYYDRFRQLMGYVPQDDIVHPQLTVREAIYFSARLRTDLTEPEIAARTEKILKDLDIADKIDEVIGSPERKILSGGQRKRVNIALELITDTPVLFLDEPTSGLSSYDADAVIDLLKGLSKAGKTVITTIHQPSLKVYKQFDDLIMISRDKGNEGEHKVGAMVYFGPAFPDSIQFFNPRAASHSTTEQRDLSPEMLFSGMNSVNESVRTETWRQAYLRSQYQREFVTERAGNRPDKRGRTGEETARRPFGLKQWFSLVHRNVIIKLRDRMQTAILLAQAPFFAVLVCLVIYPLTQPVNAETFANLGRKLVIAQFLMVIAAIWFGCNNAARDIVGELTVYRRERMVTLKLLPYVFSKLAVLLILCVFQCGSMLGIVYLVGGMHGDFLHEFLVLLISAMIGAGLGLCISAFSKTNESAIALLPVVLLPIIALAGGMRPIHELPLAGRMVSEVIPSRWAYEANLLEEAKADEWKLPNTSPESANGNVTGAPTSEVPKSGPSPAIQTHPVDVAQPFIPVDVVAEKDGSHFQPATEADYLNQETKIENWRHSYSFSMKILGLMLVLAISGVLAILKIRDREPQ